MAGQPAEGARDDGIKTTHAPADTMRVLSGRTLLHDRYEITPDARLPGLSTPSAPAFAVRDRRNSSRKLFALLCPPGLPPRVDAAAVLLGAQPAGMLPFVDWDTVHWPPLGQRCMVMVYERPLGGRLSDVLGDKAKTLREHEAQHRIIEPVLGALRDLAHVDIPHRALRPDNMFFMDTDRRKVVLGDCLTTPPGFDQPSIFETVERCMSIPAARGTGSVSDDLFALGVTLVFLLLNRNPVAQKGQEDLFYERLENGTYGTLCSGARIPLSLLEPVRGMLSDDPEERWGLRELDLWVAGRRLTPIPKRSAMRPEIRFEFDGRAHITPRTLAHAFSRNPSEAARVLGENRLVNWLKRSIGRSDLAESVAQLAEVTQEASEQGSASRHFIVPKVCALLDPSAPIRYKEFVFHRDCFGLALAAELAEKGEISAGSEVLTEDILGATFEIRRQLAFESTGIERLYKHMRGYLTRRAPGYGIERVLYELNPGLPCQSPLVVQDYVVGVDELLPALDRAAGRAGSDARPVDRHIAAFIAARLKQDVDRHLQTLGDLDQGKQIEGMLSLLALLQWRLGPEALYGLSNWIGGLLGPAIEAYHSRSARREIEREVPRLIRQGSLPRLYDLIDNGERRRSDKSGYESAIRRFAAAETEIHDIEDGGQARLDALEQKGQQMAAATSVVVSLAVICLLSIIEAW